jgi:hypothetical protein
MVKRLARQAITCKKRPQPDKNMSAFQDFRRLTNVRLLNMYGPLDTAQPSGAFAPFGLKPELGAFLMIESPSLLSDAWDAVAIDVEWSSPTGDFDFAKHYAAYNAAASEPVFFNSAFKVSASQQLGPQWQAMQISDACLFQPAGGAARWTSRFVLQPAQANEPTNTQAPSGTDGAQSGCIKLELTGPAPGFGAALYVQVLTSAIAHRANPAQPNAPDLPGMPITPLAQRITVAIR